MIAGRRYWILIWYGFLLIGVAGAVASAYWGRRTHGRNLDEILRALATILLSVGMLLLLYGVAVAAWASPARRGARPLRRGVLGGPPPAAPAPSRLGAIPASPDAPHAPARPGLFFFGLLPRESMRLRSAATALAAALLMCAGPLHAQLGPPSTGGAVAAEHARRMLGHNKRVLVIGAHPDDEDTGPDHRAGPR